MTVGMEMRRILAVAGKDLLVEGRSRAALLSVAFFAVIALLLFGFALGPDPQDLADAGAGVIWLAIFFSGILIFSRSYHVELEGGAMESLLGYPGSRRSIFAGKVLANLILLGMVEVLLLIVAAVLFHLPLAEALGEVALILLLGTFGFVVLGTFYAAISSRSRAREVLLPLLLFPMLVPLLLGAVQGTSAVLEGDAMGYGGAWIRLLMAFDLIFLTATLWVFEYVIGD